jgi:hypothetical protein
MTDEQEDIRTETWIYAGTRFTNKRRYAAWLPLGSDEDDNLHLYEHNQRTTGTVGSEYEIKVNRANGRMSLIEKTYRRQHANDDLRARLEAQHRAAETTLARKALENSDKRRSALEDVLEPLLKLADSVPAPQRDAFSVYVLRRLNSRWN